MLDVMNQTNIKYRQSFYILATVLFILFIYYVHIALYHCPRAKDVRQGEGKEENQTGNFHPIQGHRSHIHGRFGEHTFEKGENIC